MVLRKGGEKQKVSSEKRGKIKSTERGNRIEGDFVYLNFFFFF